MIHPSMLLLVLVTGLFLAACVQKDAFKFQGTIPLTGELLYSK